MAAETAANLYERTVAQIDALKAHQPTTKAEERRCAIELVRLKQAQNDLAKEVIQEAASQQIAEVIGSDHIRGPAAHLNGSNGHAPIDQPNWAQVIAATELRFEREIAALREELAAKKSGGISEGDLVELAKGLVPFLCDEVIPDAIKPLAARLDAVEKRKGIAPLAARLAGIEERMMKYDGVWSEKKSYDRGSFVTHGGSLWFAEDGSIGARPGAGSSAWKLAVKRGHAER